MHKSTRYFHNGFQLQDAVRAVSPEVVQVVAAVQRRRRYLLEFIDAIDRQRYRLLPFDDLENDMLEASDWLDDLGGLMGEW